MELIGIFSMEMKACNFYLGEKIAEILFLDICIVIYVWGCVWGCVCVCANVRVCVVSVSV